MTIRLYVRNYCDSVFVALLRANIPAPVLVVLFSLLLVNESVLVEVEETDGVYEVAKVYQYEYREGDAAHFVAVQADCEGQTTYFPTYLLWVHDTQLLGLFRITIQDEQAIMLERATHWGESWTRWAEKQGRTWRSATNDPIDQFVVERLTKIVEGYMADMNA